MDPHEYYKEVRSISDDIATEARSGEHGTGETCREWLSDYLHETIDGHQFVISTYKSQLVLAHSRNDGYAIEEFGTDSVVQDGCLNWAFLAYGALYADVVDCLDGLSLEDGSEFDINDPNPEE